MKIVRKSNQNVQQQQQNVGAQLTQEEDQYIKQLRQRLSQYAPEVGDILTNKRSREIVFAIINALGGMQTSQIKAILDKIPTQE